MINQEFVNSKLQELGNVLLKEPYKSQWSVVNPTLGYCYIVAEAVYHYSEKSYIPCCINLGKEIGTHWYLKDRVTGDILDLTAEQFDTPVDYTKGRGMGFMKGKYKTNRGYISDRGYALAKILGLVKL